MSAAPSSPSSPRSDTCPACGEPLAVDAHGQLRANIDFLLGEIRRWRAERRFDDAALAALAREYAARRAALSLPFDLSPTTAPPPPVPAGAPSPASAPTPGAVSGLAAFLDERNIAVLHIVGSLLLVGGLVALIGWNWHTWGKGAVLLLLLLLTVGLYGGGRALAERQPVSGLVLCALGALIAPLNPVAANLFGVFGRRLPWDPVGLTTAAACGVLYALTLRRTRHPLFAGFTIVGGAAFALFSARLTLPGLPHLAYAAGFLPASIACFALALRLRRREEEPRLVGAFLAGAHTLVALAVALTAFTSPDYGAVRPAAPLAAVVALLYAAVAWAFGFPALAYVAATAAHIAGQLLLPDSAGYHERTMVVAAIGAFLQGAAILHRRYPSSTGEGDAGSALVTIYDTTAVISATLGIGPVTVWLGGGYLYLEPQTNVRALAEGLAAALAASFTFGVSRLGAADVTLRSVAATARALSASFAVTLVVAAILPDADAATFCLLASFGGTLIALAAGVVSAAPRYRRRLGEDAVCLSALATLPALPLLGTDVATLPLIGLWLALAAAWALAALAAARPLLLYAACGAALVALRVLAVPFNGWGEHRLGWEPNETRWLLLAAPVFLALAHTVRTRYGRAEWAHPLYRSALATITWAGLGQIPLVFERRAPTSPALTLWLIAAGLCALGCVTRRAVYTVWSFTPCAAGYAAYAGHAFLMVTGGLSPWLVACVLSGFGACFIRTAATDTEVRLAWGGAVTLLTACGMVLYLILPLEMQPAWAICLLPLFAGLYTLGYRAENGERPSALPSLRTTTFALSWVCLLAYIPYLGIADAPLDAAQRWLLATTLIYAAVWGSLGIFREEKDLLKSAVIAATGGVALRVGGYPAWGAPAAYVGFWIAVTACAWLGLSVLLARRRAALAESLLRWSVAVAGIGAVAALAGVGDSDQGRWTVYALVVAGTVHATAGALHREARYAHTAFAAYAAAWAIFLYDYAGLSVGTADFYLIPVGLYLIGVGWLVDRTRPESADAAQRLFAAGLFLALTPTFLAAWLDRAWWHSFLLVAECVASVFVGIARRVRVFLGVGVGFLIALLAVKSYSPPREVNFGVYLTAFGLVILTAAVFFDRRRDEIRRWTDAARSAFDEWQ